jgi:exonuclease SbcC
MFQPIKIIIRDFLSIEDITYDFKTGETVLIQGINLTDTSQKSNGSGKSAFQAALDFVLTNSCARKIDSDKELIRTGCNEAFIELELSNTLYRCDLTITRTLSRKNSSTLKILENGEPVKFPTVPEGNKLLMTYLGISLKDIHNYYLPNELTYVSFFRSSDTEVKELIARFSKTTVIDKVFPHIDQDYKDKDTTESIKTEITSLETSIQIYTQQIETEESRDFEAEMKKKIDEINGKIDNKDSLLASYKSQKLSKETELSKIKSEITSLTETISQKNTSLDEFIKKTDREEFFKTLKETRDELKSSESEEKPKKQGFERQLQPLKNQLSILITQLSGKITCPKCNHEFVLESDKSVAELESDKLTCEQEIKKLEGSIETIQNKLNEIQESLDETVELESEVNRELSILRTSIKSLESEIRGYKTTLSEKETQKTKVTNAILTFNSNTKMVEDEIVSLREQIKNVTIGSVDRNFVEGLRKKIVDCEEQLTLKREELEKLGVDLQNIEVWNNRFKSFKSFLANKQLKVITGYTNHYLKQFGTDIEVSIEGYKQLSSGEMREKITAYVLRKGVSKSYGLFSKGERGKIDCAVMLALQTLINSSATSGGLDILAADETFEGMDSFGLTSLLLAMAKTKKTNLLTTHMVENLTYDNLLTFVKENGITKIKQS